jgi:RNA polymerase sigma-70 factor (ECF subfamily)
VASGWQIRRPIRRFHLAFGITRFKALSVLPRRKDVELDDEAANAIEESVEEVAEIFGIPGNTEKTRLFYARRKSAELLKAVGIERGWP